MKRDKRNARPIVFPVDTTIAPIGNCPNAKPCGTCWYCKQREAAR